MPRTPQWTGSRARCCVARRRAGGHTRWEFPRLTRARRLARTIPRTDPRVTRGIAHRFHRITVTALCVLFVVGSAATVEAQAPVESYAVNDGVNNTHDPDFGEFAPDLGGTITFDRYANSAHYFAGIWNPWAATHGLPNFAQMMRDGLMDHERLDSQLSMPRGTPPVP